MQLRRALIGRPLRTTEAAHERIGKAKALAVFSSDALSSAAYATEEILRVLVLAGSVAYAFVLPIGLAIVLLLAIVVFSYCRTIRAYPHGGGTYIVTKDNLGIAPGLLAAAALLSDYVLTVAVSISAGVAAITPAFPSLYPYRVGLAVAAIVLLTLANLRGVRERRDHLHAPHLCLHRQHRRTDPPRACFTGWYRAPTAPGPCRGTTAE